MATHSRDSNSPSIIEWSPSPLEGDFQWPWSPAQPITSASVVQDTKSSESSAFSAPSLLSSDEDAKPTVCTHKHPHPHSLSPGSDGGTFSYPIDVDEQHIWPVNFYARDIEAGFQKFGDAARLGEQRRECLRLLTLVGQHADLFSVDEYATIDNSVHQMISHLDEAAQHSSDPMDAPPLTITHRVSTGDEADPEAALQPGLASVFGVAPHTIRRRALEHGFVQLGPPVYVDYISSDGSTTHIYMLSTAPTSNLSDEELDEITEQVLELFPNLGGRFLMGIFVFLAIMCLKAAF
ncbi:hypothetical protein EV702DRAFT_1049554 [Suillus placidus]|uniref:Uncharacterized protein n=1 Tax=Suillus placidus TaxID=48579 RepID=A0A9P6ZKB2_9AGAM|nr:hypothetical protein EV702DRAFT_1049554 [Suillus placidus]